MGVDRGEAVTEPDHFRAIEAGAAEDERTAQEVLRGTGREWAHATYRPNRIDTTHTVDDDRRTILSYGDAELCEYIARHDPGRALRTAEAVRRIASLAQALRDDESGRMTAYGHSILQALAGIYQEEW